MELTQRRIPCYVEFVSDPKRRPSLGESIWGEVNVNWELKGLPSDVVTEDIQAVLLYTKSE